MLCRYRLEIEYDGEGFFGWQKQAQRRTVQGVLETAMAELTGEVAPVVGAGRTDAGVHALGQVAHVDITWRRSARELQQALNAHLPADVAIVAATEAAVDFHARYSATARRYEYWIWNSPVRPVLKRRVYWHVAAPLDDEAMACGARQYIGEHDFGAFGRPLTAGGSTIRRVIDCSVGRADQRCVVRVTGNAFLRQQVRRMVGLLVDAGRGRVAPDVVATCLRREATAPRPRLAPAHGLVLVAVDYPEMASQRQGTEDETEG